MESCRYHNEHPQLIILRCIGSCDFFLEKVIFPWESWCFDSPPDSRVEIWTYGVSGVELCDAMSTELLREPPPKDCERGLEPQRQVHARFSGRGLQADGAGSPSTEITVPC